VTARQLVFAGQARVGHLGGQTAHVLGCVAHHRDRHGQHVGELEVVEADERDRPARVAKPRSAPTVLRLFAQKSAVGRRSAGSASRSRTACSAEAASWDARTRSSSPPAPAAASAAR
jgi:hypothetical protein